MKVYALVASFILANFVFAQSNEKLLPRVLIIGDSIYNTATTKISEMLLGKAHVFKSQLKQLDTGTALQEFKQMIGSGNYDVIHFNFGLSDLHYKVPNVKSIRAMSKHGGGVRVTTQEKYKENLEELVIKLKKSSKKIIWANTTPITTSANHDIFDSGSEIEYNKIAYEVMKKHSVKVNDMHTYFKEEVLDKPSLDKPYSFDRKTIFPPILECIIEELGLKKNIKKTVKVFTMIGGSIHVGHGYVNHMKTPRLKRNGSLDNLVLNESTKNKFKHLVSAQGEWSKRSDVWITYNRRWQSSGLLSIGFGGDRKRKMGTELGLGHAFGDYFEEQVYIFKSNTGTSVVSDLRSSSSGKKGKSYDRLVNEIKESLINAKKTFPSIEGDLDFVHSGLIINFGQYQEVPKDFEKSLKSFVIDFRQSIGKPKLQTVIVGTGIGGLKSPITEKLVTIEKRVASELTKVVFVETRNYWPEVKDSPLKNTSGWHGNAESFYDVGVAIANAFTSNN
jgi:hypothetical protein